MGSYQIEDIKDQKFKVDVIRKHIRKNSNNILDQVDIAVNWYSLIKPIEEASGNTVVIGNKSFKPLLVIKSLILQQIYGLTEFPFEVEVADRKSFQKFLNLQFGDSVPDTASLKKYRETLEKDGLYDRVFDNFFKQLLDADIIPEQDLLLPSEKTGKTEKVEKAEAPVKEIAEVVKEEEVPLLKEDPLAPEQDDNAGRQMSVDDMIKEIEDRVKNLYDKKSPAEKKILEKSGLGLVQPEAVKPKVEAPKAESKEQVNADIENPVYKKLSQIDEALKQLYKDADSPKIKEDLSEKIIDTELEVKRELENTIEEKTKNIFDKLNEIDERLKNLNSPEVKAQQNIVPEPEAKKEEPSELLNKLLDIDEKLRGLHTQKAEEPVKTEPVAEKDLSEKEDLYKKLFDSFYNKLMEANMVTEATDFAKQNDMKVEDAPVVEDTPVAREEALVVPEAVIETVTETIIPVEEDKHEIIEEIEVTETIVEEKVQPEQPVAAEEETEEDTFHDFVLEGKVEKESGRTIPVVMVPKKSEINLRNKKKYPIFNNSNLTEDYELGLRFYKLGFKTSFVNLKTDRRHGNSRIATGEYFPNTFWGSVKQRSRWIAGIAFQNWKIHKWQGSLKTKYFLLRDRKAIFSAIGTFLSYIVLLYFIAFTVTSALGLDILSPIVEKNSVLWYLILLTLFFAIVRLFHRFAFTYNWYGLRYAVFSIVRLFFDNVVNFFATIRAIKVFRQTKDTVVWDSTEHY